MDRSRLLRDGLVLSASSLTPLVIASVSLLVLSRTYGALATASTAQASNLLGVAVALSAGCQVMLLRQGSMALRRGKPNDPSGLRPVVDNEMRFAIRGGLFLAGLFIIVTMCAAMLAPGSLLVFGYVLACAPRIFLMPTNMVCFGALQVLGNRRGIVTTAILQLISGLVPLIFVAVFPHNALYGVISINALQTVFFGGVAVWRVWFIYRAMGATISVRRWLATPNSLLHGLFDRGVAGVDGVVYMTVFFVATLLATRHSVHDGAVISIVVSLMRLVVIPLKQFGLAMGSEANRTGSGGRRIVADCVVVTMPICAIVAFLIGIAAGHSLGSEAARGIVPLMVIQLLLEPFAGILYTAMKVRWGATAQVRWFFGLYIFGLLPALFASSLLGWGTALTVWGLWFVTRVSFALSTTIACIRRPPSAEPGRVYPSAR